jgi:hypothetical protein
MTATKRRWFRLTALGMVALWFALLGAKTNPGGPFISVMHDIMPLGVAAFVLVAAVRCLWERARALWFFPMFPAILAIVFAARNLLEFWTNAYSRGPLIGL